MAVVTNPDFERGVCSAPNHIGEIYDVRRRNLYPARACSREYNSPAGATCHLKPSFVAQPFLRYSEPPCYDDYKRQQTDITSYANAALAAATGAPSASCSLALSCPGGITVGNMGDLCGVRREVPTGATFIPASSLPVLPLHEFEGAAPYAYENAETMQRSLLGLQGEYLPDYARFAFHTEAERLRLQYGIRPPFDPQPVPADRTTPRHQEPHPPAPPLVSTSEAAAQARGIAPIPYFRHALEVVGNDTCGCNKGDARGCGRVPLPGRVAAAQTGYGPQATPISTIYARDPPVRWGGE